jgi:nitroreductase
MNEVLETLLKRRSVRAFRDEQIKKEELDAILGCALYAPSANNTQNWHFTVIQDKAMIEKVNGWILDGMNSSGDPKIQSVAKSTKASVFRNAPCVVIVSTEKGDRFGVINISAATQNILVAAEAIGIGSCWIGSVGILASSDRVEEYSRELGIPEGYTPYFGITLGYRTSSAQPAPPRKEGAVNYIPPR